MAYDTMRTVDGLDRLTQRVKRETRWQQARQQCRAGD